MDAIAWHLLLCATHSIRRVLYAVWNESMARVRGVVLAACIATEVASNNHIVYAI